MKEHLRLASRNLKREGIRSWLTLLGVLIGIAAVVSLISLGNGLKDAVNAQFNIGSTEVISVQAGGISSAGPPGSAVAKPLTLKDAEDIGKLSAVEVSIPRNVRTIKMEFNDRVAFTFSASIPSDGILMNYVYDLVELKTSSGRLLETGERGSVVIGSSFKDGEGNGFGKNLKVGDKIKINGKDFRIRGILEKKGSFIIDGSVLMNEDDLKDLLNYGDEVDLIAVKVIDSSYMDKAKEDIEKLLRRNRDVKVGEEDFEVSTPQSSLESVNQIISGIQAFIVIIAFMSIIVGVIGISNTMATSVIERRKEIGIMKSIGARNSDIFYLFFFEAGLLGLVGGILGVLFGVGIGYLGVSALNNFLGATTSINISIPLIVSALLGSFAIGSISGIVPAMNAAKLNPVEALRK